MKCFVCGGEMRSFMKKSFGMKNLDECEYHRCEECGLVVSKTLYEMPPEQWEALNHECHSLYQGRNDAAEILAEIDPQLFSRLKAQSQLFLKLIRLGVFKLDWEAVDYGAGDGTLANMINAELKFDWLKKFDAYMSRPNENYLPPSAMQPATFDFLVTCSVFEHLLGNNGDVDKILNLVKSDGTFALHTLVCEEIPHDPNWYYLYPVHCTLWTNKAMSIVYKKFGFKGCAYHVDSRMWLMFRDESIFAKLQDCHKEIGGTWQFGEDFVDYWKVKPYRK